MRQIIKVELNRAFRSAGFLFAVMIGSAMSLWYFIKFSWPLIEHILRVQSGTASESFFKKVYYATPVAEGWMGTHIADGYFLVLPILCAIPYGISYYMDNRNGYVNQLTTRVKRSTYIKAKMTAVFISGGAVAVIPMILNLLLCMCFLPIMYPVSSTQLFPVSAGSVLSELFYSKSWSFLYIIIYIIFDFVFFGLLNGLTLFMSCFVDNRFTIILSPFIISFGLHVAFGWWINKSGWSPLNFTYLPNMQQVDLLAVLVEMLILVVCMVMFFRLSKQDVL